MIDQPKPLPVDSMVIDPLPTEVQECIDAYGRYYAEHHKIGMSVRDDMRYVASVAIRFAARSSYTPTPEAMWRRFIAHLNAVEPIVFKKADGPVPHTSFLGSIERYKELFLAANAPLPEYATLTPLSEEAKAARKPPPPEVLVGALQDTIHTDTGRTRPATSARVALSATCKHGTVGYCEPCALIDPGEEASASATTPECATISRNWTEDFAHENGNYNCQCVDCDNPFIGHKRRIQCKACAEARKNDGPTPSSASAIPPTGEEIEYLGKPEDISRAHRIYRDLVASRSSTAEPLKIDRFDLADQSMAAVSKVDLDALEESRENWMRRALRSANAPRTVPVELLDRYEALLVTSERHGNLIIPLFHAIPSGEKWAAVASQLDDMTKDRDHWKREAERSSSPATFTKVMDLIESINADRYGKPLIAALHLCNDLAQAVEDAMKYGHEWRLKAALATKAERSSTTPAWISVTERLPADGTTAWIWAEGWAEVPLRAIWIDQNKVWNNQDSISFSQEDVTHWTPLLAAPLSANTPITPKEKS